MFTFVEIIHIITGNKMSTEILFQDTFREQLINKKDMDVTIYRYFARGVNLYSNLELSNTFQYNNTKFEN